MKPVFSAIPVLPGEKRGSSGTGVFFLVFFLFLPVFLFAQNSNFRAGPQAGVSEYQAESFPENPRGRIASIEVTGLKRTKTAVTDYALERFIGRDAERLDTNEVRAAIIDTGVLDPVSVELVQKDGGVVIQVQVEEKWSFFPIPMLLVDSGETNFGLFIADTNAFGLRDQAVVGGMYGLGGWTGMVMYRNTPERNNFPGWNAVFMYSSRKKADQNREQQTLRRYEAAFLRASAGLEYPVTGKLNLFFTVSFTDIAVSTPVLNAPEEGNRYIGFSPGIAYRSSIWDGYLLSERSLSVSYGYMPAFVGSSFHELDMDFVFAVPVVPGFVASLKGKANSRPGAGSTLENGPDSVGIDILPKNFSALHYAGAATGLEKYLFKTRYGTLSAFFSWQAVFSSGSLSGETFDHGPTGGLRFYLSKVAIPALGFTAAYNMTTFLSQFSFSMGMSF
jgi:outer membrane protein assembly factor BamA